MAKNIPNYINTSQREVTGNCVLIGYWPRGGGGGAEGDVCILCSTGIAASPICLLSMGGVCGRS